MAPRRGEAAVEMRHEDKIPLIGRLRGPHTFTGTLLGPLALKLSSTGS